MITPTTLSTQDPTAARSAVAPFPTTAANAADNAEQRIAGCAKTLDDGKAP
jgi:hypothetical protein